MAWRGHAVNLYTSTWGALEERKAGSARAKAAPNCVLSPVALESLFHRPWVVGATFLFVANYLIKEIQGRKGLFSVLVCVGKLCFSLTPPPIPNLPRMFIWERTAPPVQDPAPQKAHRGSAPPPGAAQDHAYRVFTIWLPNLPWSSLLSF